jgi:nitrite reductase/ring-hydroxylating ferredoxin subunit
MSTWHRLGTHAEVAARAPYAAQLDGHAVAVFLHEGRVHAIGNACNHKGGPLAEGRRRGEFVVCPWHAWEYSVVTGRGPEGYDEEQVPVFGVEERADGVFVATPPELPRKLLKHKPCHLLEEHAKPAGAPPRVLGLSTTAMDDANPRYSTSDALLEHALERSAPTPSSSGSASFASAPARGTTRRPRAPAPGRAPSPSAIPRTSSRRSTRASCTGRT